MSRITKNMNEFNKKMSRAGEKFSGRIKKTTGKITGNEQLELKGRMQIAKANFIENVSIKRNINDIKEVIANRINEKLDKKKKEK